MLNGYVSVQRSFRLWQLNPNTEPLRKKKCSTYYLRNKCAKYNSDNKTIKRLMSDESVSTNTLNSICNILDCDIKEIMEFQPDKDTDIDTNIDTDSNT